MNDQKLLMDLVGWVGAATLLIAYLLVSKGKVSAKTIFYQNLNIFGSLCLVINTYYYGTISLVFLNAMWALIGLYSLKTVIKKN